jgi:hypothetical protein
MGAYRDLRALSDDELERKYDASLANVSVGLEYYRTEILRRETARGTAELIALTRRIRSLTVTVAAATILALAISVVAVLR